MNFGIREFYCCIEYQSPHSDFNPIDRKKLTCSSRLIQLNTANKELKSHLLINKGLFAMADGAVGNPHKINTLIFCT